MRIQKTVDYVNQSDVTLTNINASLQRIQAALRMRYIDDSNIYRDSNNLHQCWNSITNIVDIPTDSKIMIGDYVVNSSYADDSVFTDINKFYNKSLDIIREEYVIRDVSIIKSMSKELFQVLSPKKKKEISVFKDFWDGTKSVITAPVKSVKNIFNKKSFTHGWKKKKKKKKENIYSTEEYHIVEKPKGCILDDISYSGDIYIDAVTSTKQSKAQLVVVPLIEDEESIQFKLMVIFYENLADTEYVNVEFKLQLKFRRIM